MLVTSDKCITRLNLALTQYVVHSVSAKVASLSFPWSYDSIVTNRQATMIIDVELRLPIRLMAFINFWEKYVSLLSYR